MKKKILYTGLLIVMLGLTGCGKSEAQAEGTISVEEDTAQIESTAEEIMTLAESDAIALIQEKLMDTKAEIQITDSVTIGEDPCYLAEITVDGEKLFQQLAVNGVSGEVGVYNEDTGTVEDYSTFELYNQEANEEIDWNGTYEAQDTELSITAEEPGSFEAAFMTGGKDAGTVFASSTSNRDASAEADGEKLQFVIRDDVVTITSDQKDSVYAGEYRKK